MKTAHNQLAHLCKMLNWVNRALEISQRPKRWCSTIDWLTFKFLPCSIALLAAIATTKSGFLKSMECTAPTIPQTENFRGYMEQFCLINANYLVLPSSLSKELPVDNYQNIIIWIPVVMLAQALSLLVPQLFWEWATSRDTGNLEAIWSSCTKIIAGEGETAELQFTLTKQLKCWAGVGYRCRLIISYLLMKMVALQVLVLNMALIFYYLFDGQMCTLINGKAKMFPRILYCDIDLSQVGSHNHFFAQCVYPLNYVYEKLYIALIWILMLTWVAHVLDTFYLCIRLLCKHCWLRKGLGHYYPHGFNKWISPDLYLVLLLISSKLDEKFERGLIKNLFQGYSFQRRMEDTLPLCPGANYAEILSYQEPTEPPAVEGENEAEPMYIPPVNHRVESDNYGRIIIVYKEPVEDEHIV